MRARRAARPASGGPGDSPSCSTSPSGTASSAPRSAVAALRVARERRGGAVRVLVLGGTLFLGRHLVESGARTAATRSRSSTAGARAPSSTPRWRPARRPRRGRPGSLPQRELGRGRGHLGARAALGARLGRPARRPRRATTRSSRAARSTPTRARRARTSARRCTGSRTRRSRRSRAPRSTAASRCSASGEPSGRCPGGRSRSAPG